MTKEELQTVKNYILNYGAHDDLCNALELDEEGKHMNCSCGLTSSLAILDNALAQKEQEPVAWVLEWTFNGEEKGRRLYDDETHCKFDAGSDGGVCRPLVYGDAAPVAQPNQMLVEALKELHSVVIDQNRAGTDWGDRLGRLMTALGNSKAALAAVGEK